MLKEFKELKLFADRVDSESRKHYLRKLNKLHKKLDVNYVIILPNKDVRIIKGLDALSVFLELSPRTIQTYLSRGSGKFVFDDIVVQRKQ